jgi:hypothetical protein
VVVAGTRLDCSTRRTTVSLHITTCPVGVVCFSEKVIRIQAHTHTHTHTLNTHTYTHTHTHTRPQISPTHYYWNDPARSLTYSTQTVSFTIPFDLSTLNIRSFSLNHALHKQETYTHTHIYTHTQRTQVFFLSSTQTQQHTATKQAPTRWHTWGQHHRYCTCMRVHLRPRSCRMQSL